MLRQLIGFSTIHVSFPRWTQGIRLMVASLMMVFAAGCEPYIDASMLGSPPTEHRPYTLGPGDQIRITVYEHDDLSGSHMVDDAGTIAAPLLGRMSVKGLTVPELEKQVTDELISNHIVDPQVSIELELLRPFCVFGEVRAPGC